MKLFLTLLCIGIQFIISAQVDWDELAPHNAEDVEILHVSQDRILGMLNYAQSRRSGIFVREYNPDSPRLVISEDQGTSWSVVAEGLPAEDNTPLVDLDQNGNYIFLFEHSVSRFDIQSLTLEELFTLSIDNNWSQIGILPNGNIVIREREGVWLYDTAGLLLNRLSFGARTLSIHLGDGDEHYLILKPDLFNGHTVKFNSNLDLLEQNDDVTFKTQNHFSYSGGRLYSESGYTDDGRNWIDYPGGLTGLVTLLDNGKLHLISGCGSYNPNPCTSIYISEDKGETFTYMDELDLDITLPSSDFVDLRYTTYVGSGSHGTNGVLLFNERNNFYSKDGITDWIPIGLEVGKPFAIKVEASTLDNVFLGTSNDWPRVHKYFITSDNGQWRALNDKGSCGESLVVTSMPDNSILDLKGCYSTDEGENWIRGNIENAVSSFVTNEVAYLVSAVAISTSLDYGRTWETFDWPNMFQEVQFYDISASRYLYSNDFSTEGIQRFTLDGQLDSNIDLGSGWVADLSCSYRGPEVYAITRDNNLGTEVKFLVSLDDGDSFQEGPIPNLTNSDVSLFTDHIGNVFLYSEEQVFLSDDQGASWIDITPNYGALDKITGLDVSWDNYIFLSTKGTGVLRSSEPLAEPNILNVLVYEDLNGNCAYDASEPGLKNIQVNVGNRMPRTDENGNIKLFMSEGQFPVNATLRSEMTSCDNQHMVEFLNSGERIDVSIPLTVIEECVDLNLGSSLSFLRRCFENNLFLEIYNDGTELASGVEMTIILDEYFNYIDSDFEVLNVNGQEVVFRVGDIEPRSSVRGKILFELSCDAELGEAHYVEGSLEYDNACDPLLFSAESFECRENVGSYDPNDKSIYVDGFKDKELIGEDSEIEYLVRFQNTGTDTAFTVRIEDQLSADFDLFSLVPVVASHDYKWSVERDRRLVVTFNDINLVDSFTNESASHGFVKFRAALTAERPAPGDIVNNTAEIYFDFNEPIVTNTVETFYLCQHTSESISVSICPGDEYEGYSAEGTYEDAFVTSLGCDSMRTLELIVLEDGDAACVTATRNVENSSVRIYPLPASSQLNVNYTGNKEIAKYALVDMRGRTIKHGHASSEFHIVSEGINSGLYMLRLLFKDGESTYKRVVIVN